MTHKHTQGPWHARATEEQFPTHHIWAGNVLIGQASAKPNNAESKANADLMTSSPYMLEALEGVLHHNDAVKEAHKLPNSLVRQIVSALVKAKGYPADGIRGDITQ